MGLAITRSILKNYQGNVVAIARTEGDLPELQSEFGGDRISICLGDVKQPETYEKALKVIQEQYSGRLASVVLNAGVLDPVQKICDVSLASWRNCFEVNVTSLIIGVGEPIQAV